jgi:hypothetical protein
MMSERSSDELLVRIESLEQAIRRWKRFALGTLAALVLFLTAAVYCCVFYYQGAIDARDQANQALREAEAQRIRAMESENVAAAHRDEAEMQRRLAEQRLQQALQAMEKLRKEAAP